MGAFEIIFHDPLESIEVRHRGPSVFLSKRWTVRVWAVELRAYSIVRIFHDMDIRVTSGPWAIHHHPSL